MRLGSLCEFQMTITRCLWAQKITDEEYLRYHDEEWSTPHVSDRDLLELLCLEGAQSGLSWQTILKKRKAYREAFHNFEILQILKMTSKDEDKILTTGTVVKHGGKIKVCHTCLLGSCCSLLK